MVFADAARAEITNTVAGALADRLARDAGSPELRDFYARRAYAPIWVDAEGPLPRARLLAAALGDAEREGLDPTRYDAAPAVLAAGRGGADRLAETELALSRMLLRYAREVRAGRVPSRIRYHGIAGAAAAPPEVLLARAATAPSLADLVAELAPRDPGYARLRAALARYRAIAASGGWPKVPAIRSLAPGTTAPAIAILRQRLAATGDLVGVAAAPASADRALVEALRRFQARHGLPETGTVDALTRAALNVPAAARAETIALNLERRRWLSDEAVMRGVIVNAAAFGLELVERGRTVFATRVIVGTCDQKTPQFATLMTGVQFNPYWNVPQSIANNEILPRLKRDPGYLARQKIKLFVEWGGREVDPRSVDWKALSRMPYKLRQEPGEGNSLGRIRFLMPNPYNVYLHDTPAKRLFERRARAFSHGCIRVQRPDELAAALLKGNGGWSLAQVRRAAAAEDQVSVAFAQPIPVVVGYFTAWVGEDGVVQFREDHYRRDASLAAALRTAAAQR